MLITPFKASKVLKTQAWITYPFPTWCLKLLSALIISRSRYLVSFRQFPNQIDGLIFDLGSFYLFHEVDTKTWDIISLSWNSSTSKRSSTTDETEFQSKSSFKKNHISALIERISVSAYNIWEVSEEIMLPTLILKTALICLKSRMKTMLKAGSSLYMAPKSARHLLFVR